MIERILYNRKADGGYGGFAIPMSGWGDYYGDVTAVISKIVVSNAGAGGYPLGVPVEPGTNIPSNPYNYAVHFSLMDYYDYSDTLFHRALLSTKSAQNPTWDARTGPDSRVEFGKGMILKRNINSGDGYGIYWNIDSGADVAFKYNVTIFGTYILE